MSVLLLNQFYGSDSAATGQLLADVADYLAEKGEVVNVICGTADYGAKGPGSVSGGRVIRLPNAAFSRKLAGRMGSYLSFLAGAAWKGLRTERPSVVLTLTTPPLLSLVGLAIQRFRGAKHVIWEMDVYPDVAVDLGVMKAGGILSIVFGWLADVPRHRADTIIVLGECMRARLLRHGIPDAKIVIAENWSDAVTPKPLPTGPLSILYSGNFGLAHDFETVSDTISACKDEPISFVFAGGGPRYDWLREFCKQRQLNNVQFLPYCDRDQLGDRIGSGHIGLVTQKDDCLGSVVPSKTYGIMAASRPVLFIGPKDSTPALVIARHNCGWQIDCGDTAGLTRLIRRLSTDTELIAEAGQRARQAFLEHYQRSIGAARVAAVLERASRERKSADKQPGSAAA